MIRFETAQPRHASLIAGCMRERDIAEVRAGWQMRPYDAIRKALGASYYARVCLYGLEPLAIYGLAPLSGGASQVWVFGTAWIDRHPIAFARASRRALNEIYRHASCVTNLIDLGDEPAVRWLTWLGGSYVAPPAPRADRVFRQFILRCECRQG